MSKHVNSNNAAQCIAANANDTPLSHAQPLALTPSEFAKRFNRHPVWGYRQVYKGHVRVLGTGGRMLIPISEIEKFLARTVVYSGRTKHQAGLKKQARKAATPDASVRE